MKLEHGFRLLSAQTIPELGGEARFYRHEKTGAELVSVINQDENKVFGITLRTPPSDSTGIAHILEHSVLCGSKNYPLKEPFVELIKGSLKTFLNAFTYPDKTCYPVASQNTQDLYNLAAVYFDAVFYPLIDEWTFMQEGWHLHLDRPDGQVYRKGVVYNEMQGVYSSPDSLLYENSQRVVFPDITYGFDSGGDPRVIPELDHQKFKEFHRAFYHPVNSRIWFWGDDEPEQRLAWLDERLSEFEPAPRPANIPLQPRFSTPREETVYYSASPEEKKAMFTINWLFGEQNSAYEALACQILEEILIGQSASPLKRALIESGLGEALAGAGLEGELREFYFSLGLRGIEPAKIDQAEALIDQTLGELVKNGVPAEIREAALNTVEFALREHNTGNFPQGLSLMLAALTTWLYERDPLERLPYEAPLAELKTRLARGERVFEELIQKHLVSNRHRIRLKLLPDPELAQRQAEREAAELKTCQASLSPTELAEIFKTSQALEKLQTREDDPAVLANLPSLKVSDLEPKFKPLPRQASPSERILISSPETHGIVYLDLAFDLSGVPVDLLPWVRTWAHALTEIGTEAQDYASFSTRIARETGGIGASDIVLPNREGQPVTAIVFRARVLAEHLPKLIAILKEMFLTPRLGDSERFGRILSARRARIEKSLINSGHSLVDGEVRAMLSTTGSLGRLIRGLGEFETLRKAGDKPATENLKLLQKNLITRSRLKLALTASPDLCEQAAKTCQEIFTWLPNTGAADWQTNHPLEALPANPLGLSGPLKINFVAQGLDMAQAGYRPHGAALIATRLLSSGWLWNTVRVQGGAYGAFCRYSQFSGILTMASYRDPNLDETLARYREAADWLKNFEWSGLERERAIIGAIGELDAWKMPDARGFAELVGELTGLTKEMIQEQRDQVFKTTKRELLEFAEALGGIAGSQAMAAFGEKQGIEAWAQARGGRAVSLL